MSFLFVAVFGGSALLLFTSGGVPSLAQSLESEPAIQVFWDDGFGGRSLLITETAVDLPVELDDEGNDIDWNDQITSIVVLSGTWRLHQHGRCNTQLDDAIAEELDVATKASAGGWSCLVSANSQGAVEYPGVGSGPWANDEISSIKLVSAENLPDWAILGPRQVAPNPEDDNQ